MNQPRERISFNAVGIAAICVTAVIVAVIAALAVDALWMLIGGVIVSGVIAVVLARIGVNLFSRWTDARIKARSLEYEHDERMAKIGYLPNSNRYKPILQLEAPREPENPAPIKIDPRHDLLVNLCLLTIKSAEYGPTSRKLMTADDAQADRSGLFADRMNWDSASKYGQSIGYLFTQRGGKPEEQGLKIDCGDEGKTASDLLVALHNRNISRDSAINTLPGVTR